MSFISLTCNSSSGKERRSSLISILYKQPASSLILQTIYIKIRAVSGPGCLRDVINNRLAGSCRDLFSTLGVIQPVHRWPEKTRERCLTAPGFFREIGSTDKSRFISPGESEWKT